jgi:hypothetical protein
MLTSQLPAAKDTWRLMRDRGINALINDSLVGIGAQFPPTSFSGCRMVKRGEG